MASVVPSPYLPPQMVKKERKFLFVEDDPLVVAVVAPALRSAGFTVHEATNAKEAMQTFEQDGPFDAVFSDIVMPGEISGIDLAQYILKKNTKARVVLATGYSERRLDVQGVAMLAKPYDVNDVI